MGNKKKRPKKAEAEAEGYAMGDVDTAGLLAYYDTVQKKKKEEEDSYYCGRHCLFCDICVCFNASCNAGRC